MQTATITLLLAGDSGNTVQKFDVTPSEIAVLRVIHGDDAVIDIEPTGEVKRTSRAERERLIERYGRTQANGQFGAPAVEALFPGIAARTFEKFDELELDESFFKAETRVTSKKPAVKKPVVEQAEEPAAEQEEASADAETTEGEEDDGIGDIDDNVNDNLFK